VAGFGDCEDTIYAPRQYNARNTKMRLGRFLADFEKRKSKRVSGFGHSLFTGEQKIIDYVELTFRGADLFCNLTSTQVTVQYFPFSCHVCAEHHPDTAFWAIFAQNVLQNRISSSRAKVLVCFRFRQ
jgi:hypothetical protein